MVAKARQQCFPHIRLMVTVGIFQVNNLRSVAYDDAFSPSLDIERKSQFVLKYNSLVKAAVVVLVKQHFDRTTLFAFIGNVVRVVWNLSDPQAAVVAEVDSDRIFEEWLGRGD